jgi:hypothetical protein
MTAAVDPCLECGRGTAGVLPGTKLLVGINRVPTNDGYLCEMCAGYDCDECGGGIPVDCEVRCGDGMTSVPYNYHEHCYDERKHGRAEFGLGEED